MVKIEQITKQVMTNHKRLPGRTKQEGTLAGAPNTSLTKPDPLENLTDLKRTALGPAGLSQELSEAIEAAKTNDLQFILDEIDKEGEPTSEPHALGEPTSEPYILEEIVVPNPNSPTINLQMDSLTIKDKYSAQISYLKNYYSDISSETIDSILNLDLQSYNQIPHALLAIAMLYGFSFEDENFFNDINRTQEAFSDLVIDKMHVFMRTRNKRGTCSLLQEVFYNFELAASQEVTTSYLTKPI